MLKSGHVGGDYDVDQPGQYTAQVQDQVHRHLAAVLPPHPGDGDIAPHRGGSLQQKVGGLSATSTSLYTMSCHF